MNGRDFENGGMGIGEVETRWQSRRKRGGRERSQNGLGCYEGQVRNRRAARRDDIQLVGKGQQVSKEDVMPVMQYSRHKKHRREDLGARWTRLTMSWSAIASL